MSFEMTHLGRECHGKGDRGTLLMGDGSRGELVAAWAGQAQCVYVDPPFQTGNDFVRRQPFGEEGWEKGKPFLTLAGYGDKWDRQAYVELLTGLADCGRSLLGNTGVFYMHLDWRGSALARMACDQVFGEKAFMNEIIWAYETGGRAQRHFSRKHDTILMYAAGKHPRFDLTRVPIGRHGNRQNHLRRTMDEQGRPCRTIRSGGKLYRYYDDEPVYPTDVWTDVPHLQQRDPARTGWPTQKPIRLLSRLIRPVCQPGDLVADLCCGSGTTLAAALEEGCRFLGVDSSGAACALTRKRLLGTDMTLDIPCAGTAATLAGEVHPAGITLTAYTPAPHGEMPELHGLDALEQWSAGRVREGCFYPAYSFARSGAAPALPQSCFLPGGEGELAVETIDLWGEKRLFLYR